VELGAKQAEGQPEKKSLLGLLLLEEKCSGGGASVT
jgi:hypothetical protein